MGLFSSFQFLVWNSNLSDLYDENKLTTGNCIIFSDFEGLSIDGTPVNP